MLNFQGLYSFGKACFYTTTENDPNNLLRCQALALLNLACRDKPKVIYKMEISLDIDGSKKEAKEEKAGRASSVLARLLLNDYSEKAFISARGQNLIDLLKYSVTKHYAQNAQDGESKTVSCLNSGFAKTTFIKSEFIVTMNQCQHASDSILSASTITWSGDFQGILTYSRFSNDYYLNWVSMSGNLQHNGTINSKSYGIRGIDENCRVTVDYKGLPGIYTFCGRSNN